MSDTPTPNPEVPSAPAEPTAAQAAVPAPKEPKPSRIRRLWRWSKKWGKRFALFLLVLILVTSAVYSVHRHQAFKASDKALADVRAELDATEPGWRYEDIEAAHNATKPPDDKNSRRIIERYPEIKERERPSGLGVNRSTINYHLERLGKSTSNELPSEDILEFADLIATDMPPNHPALQQLVHSTRGWIPMNSDPNLFDLYWDPLRSVSLVGTPLELAAASTAARQRYPATLTYAQCSVNAGRSVGTMPRVMAQFVRVAGSVRATRMITRMLSWGEPDVDTTELQSSLLAEAEVDWVPAACRAERAVRHFLRDRLTFDEEVELLFALQPNQPGVRVDLETRATILLARPYQGIRLAQATAEVNDAIAICAKPRYERQQGVNELDEKWKSQETPTMFHRVWDKTIRVSVKFLVESDLKACAELRNAAVALACERFRRVNGRWPSALNEIPKEMLAVIPTDPFNGKPMRYKKLKDGAIIYCLRLNGRDADEIEEPIDAVTFRLWNPELRGLPWKDPFAQPEKPDAPNPDKP